MSVSKNYNWKNNKGSTCENSKSLKCIANLCTSPIHSQWSFLYLSSLISYNGNRKFQSMLM